MYVPAQFEETDRSVLHALIAAHPLGAWVTQGDGELIVNHVPFLIDASRGPHGTLVGHVARANPVWRSFSSRVPSVIVFQGADAYISPSWYPSARDHGKVLPTWNYAVVHAHGMPRVLDDDPAWLYAHLERLIETHEAAQARPWKLSDAPEDYIRERMNGIVGIEIPIDRLVGKWKVGQNRPDADKLGVIAGLREAGGARRCEMADLVEERLSVPPARESDRTKA